MHIVRTIFILALVSAIGCHTPRIEVRTVVDISSTDRSLPERAAPRPSWLEHCVQRGRRIFPHIIFVATRSPVIDLERLEIISQSFELVLFRGKTKEAALDLEYELRVGRLVGNLILNQASEQTLKFLNGLETQPLAPGPIRDLRWQVDAKNPTRWRSSKVSLLFHLISDGPRQWVRGDLESLDASSPPETNLHLFNLAQLQMLNLQPLSIARAPERWLNRWILHLSGQLSFEIEIIELITPETNVTNCLFNTVQHAP